MRSGSRGLDASSKMSADPFLIGKKDQQALSQLVQGLRQIQSKEINKEGVNYVYQQLDQELHRLFTNSNKLLNIKGPILMSKFQKKKSYNLEKTLKNQLTAKKAMKSVTFKKEIIVSNVDQENDDLEEN